LTTYCTAALVKETPPRWAGLVITNLSGIAYDKLRLSENRPTSISASTGTQGIQAKLKEIAQRTQALERLEKAKLVSE